MKKDRKENDIKAALQRLDRLTQDADWIAAAQNFQFVNKTERKSFPICSVLIDERGHCTLFAGSKVLRNIREWLSPPDPWKNHYVVLDTRHSETGTWLIQGETYAEWKSSGSGSLLWIKGKRLSLVFI